MRVTLALGLRAICVAAGLVLASARAADPVSPLIGATKEQLLSRYGEPRSQIEAGSRVIYFYPREKIVLRDNVVVEVEPLGAEPARPGGTVDATPPATKSQPGTTSTEPTAPAARGTTPQPATAPSGQDAKVEIKFIKPPGKDGVPAESPAATPAQPVTSSVSTTPAPMAPKQTVVDTPPPAPPSVPAQKTESAITRSEPVVKSAPPPEGKKKAEAPPKKKEEKQAPEPKAAAPATDPQVEVGVLGSRIFMLLAGAVFVGVLLLIWRYRQRQAVLAATSVSGTSMTPATATTATTASAAPFSGSGFNAEEIANLDARRFEELVAAYYSKTGVVAVQTKAGPENPVHIKISWKGEPRPFAYVQCLAQPAGLIDAKPLQALVKALEADNIRRGYVVTSGKFNVQARNYAEEKHLTLLPAEVFLEKLNALPSAARAEIAKSISGAPGATA